MSSAPDKAKDIFLIAVEQHAPDNWPSYLDEACADNPELRRRVELLLEAHEGDESLLDSPAIAPPATIDHPLTEKPGTQIGPYKLLQQLGEGGMGVVYMAEQKEPVKRRVALKIIKPGMDTRQVIARFEAERQALAMMDHPNIAKVLDAGATASGRPYFVMDLVNGLPVTKFCDEQHLTPKERLELFIPICQAVQHAHQKGIIHRDLKPSNILVALYDGQPVPKVIDFGVAKATSQTLTEKTMFTQLGQVVGTLEYMSPEQAERNQLDIDTRSDIYSLGVVLYELLTGETPFDRTRLRSAAFDEMLRIIREEEPSKPSTKVSSSLSLPSIAANRRIEPAKLGSMIRGELDWIVMKAMEKDRGRRYESASGFAKDIERFLHEEPVAAGPPSAIYRLRKFAQRNRRQVFLAALLLLALLAGIAGTSYGMFRADHMRRLAEQSANAERLAKVKEAAERVKAEQARDRTRAVLDAMTSEITGDLLAAQTQVSDDQKKFLREVLSYYREFAGEHADDPQVRDLAADAAQRVGKIELRLGNREQAIVAFQRAQDDYEKLAADFPLVKDYRKKLGQSHLALALFDMELGNFAEGEKHGRQAVDVYTSLVDEFPSVPDFREGLATTYMFLGIHSGQLGLAAEEYHLKSLELYDRLVADFPAVPRFRWQLAEIHRLVANAQRNADKVTEAEQHCRKGLALLEKLLVEFPADPDSRPALAICHHELGTLLSRQEDGQAEAREHLLKAIDILEQLSTQYPSVPEYRSNLAAAYNGLGGLLSLQGGLADAEEPFRKAVAVAERLTLDFPTVLSFRVKLGTLYLNYADQFQVAGRTHESLSWYAQAINVLTPIQRASPGDVEARRSLMVSHVNRGKAHLGALDDPGQSIDDFSRAIELASATEKWHLCALLAIAYLRADRVAEASTTLAWSSEAVTFLAGNSPKDNAEGMSVHRWQLRHGDGRRKTEVHGVILSRAGRCRTEVA